jgi:hypothetical protein
MSAEGPYGQRRLEAIVRSRQIVDSALDKRADMPPHDEAELAATAHHAWEQLGALFRLNDL